ncbi:Cypovirus VP9 [Hubei lepidoptera virus 3]|uniref:Cypovirus VP9 n=1 Tax=Hubei lepidoptera virus 3 TaxID=1922905 RepID=UPI00090AD200|nr:Cypovirus VP9 [Hubei lepidoptera virus 3]APG79101.1 Cypovirus VP9 [Hubei lepidoptera virus 3]
MALSSLIFELRKPKFNEDNTKIAKQYDTVFILNIPCVGNFIRKVNDRIDQFSDISVSREQRKFMWCTKGLLLVSVSKGDILYRENDVEEYKKQDYGRMIKEATVSEDDSPIIRNGLKILKLIKWDDGANEILGELEDGLDSAMNIINDARSDLAIIEKVMRSEKMYDTSRFCNEIRFILAAKLINQKGMKLPLLKYLYEDVRMKELLIGGNANSFLLQTYISVKNQDGQIIKTIPTMIRKGNDDEQMTVQLLGRVRFYGTDVSLPYIKKGILNVPMPVEHESMWGVKANVENVKERIEVDLDREY